MLQGREKDLISFCIGWKLAKLVFFMFLEFLAEVVSQPGAAFPSSKGLKPCRDVLVEHDLHFLLLNKKYFLLEKFK